MTTRKKRQAKELAADNDPITLEVVNNALETVADEMALIIMRSAYSPIVRDSMDYSTAVCDRDGRMVAQGLTTALHLGSFPDAMAVLTAEYEDRMKPGDVFITNDPYGGGGMHLPDIYVIKPIFVDQRLEGFATTLVHHIDLGGIAPGSIAVYATEIFQEGLCIPLTKLFDRGVPNETIFRFIEKNVRVPRLVLGDLRAQLAACHSAERSYSRLVSRYGGDSLYRYQDALHEQAERAMRQTIADLPDGLYRYEDFIDGFGSEPEPVRFKVAVTIKGDEADVDWTGTSSQVKAAINAPGPFLRSATYLAFRCLAPVIPNTIGYMRPIKVSAPSGTVVNPKHPAACNARGITGFRILDTVLGALAQAVPKRVPASGEGGAVNISFGGMLVDEPFVFAETVLGAWGGRSDRDGLDGAANLAANQSNQPIELIESQYPIEITHYGLVPDSGGPGQYRGGLALRRDYRLTTNDVTFTMRTDRRWNLPYGIASGKVGTPGWVIIEPEGRAEEVPVLPRDRYLINKSETVQLILAGGGGYGDPLDRNPTSVLEDILDGKLTEDYARREYGVVLNETGALIDQERTAALRVQLREGGPTDALSHVEAFEKALGVTSPSR
jgi:N-methylhydantoinase B